jgi:heme exporter protein A
MASEPLIRVTGLRKTFGNHRVLDGLDLDVRAGEAVAVLGANGAGKTTLLKVLATLMRPTRGTVTVAGHDCAKEPERVRSAIGLVAHSSYVYEDLTAAENLTFWATLAGLRPSAAERAAALATVELERAADARVRTFSAGMKRRLSLARFVLARPRVLLLDEPFTGLDAEGRTWVAEFLRAFKARGGAAVLVTHSFGAALDVSDRVAILAGGQLVTDRPCADLSTDELNKLYTGLTEDGNLSGPRGAR